LFCFWISAAWDFSLSLEKIWTGCLIFEKLALKKGRQHMKLFIQATVCVLVVSVLAACTTCKIEPPQTAVSADKQLKAEAAANALTTAVSGASAGVDYHNVVNRTYVTVGQDDVAFYLLMQAYNCESSRGHTAQAAEILRLARQELARRHRAQPPSTAVAVTSTSLTATEHQVLKNSPLKNDIQKTIAVPKAAPSASPAASPGAKPAKQHKTKAKPSPSPSP